jgi:hypothetical protein
MSSGKKPTHLGPIDRISPYLRTSELRQGRIYQPNSTRYHPRELRQTFQNAAYILPSDLGMYVCAGLPVNTDVM